MGRFSKRQKSYEGLRELSIVIQFTHSFQKELSVFLRERSVKDLHNFAIEAENYLREHGRSLPARTNVIRSKAMRVDNEQYPSQNNNNRVITCFNCHREGHISRYCKYKGNDKKERDY